LSYTRTAGDTKGKRVFVNRAGRERSRFWKDAFYGVARMSVHKSGTP